MDRSKISNLNQGRKSNSRNTTIINDTSKKKTLTSFLQKEYEEESDRVISSISEEVSEKSEKSIKKEMNGTQTIAK